VSFSFHVPCERPPRFSTVVDAIGEPDWAVEEATPADDAFARSVFYHPYLRGRAARGIELGWDDDTFEVRILTCSSRADYELGVKTALVLARLANATVHPEGDEPLSIDSARAKYGDAWIDRMLVSGPPIVLQMAAKNGIVLSGPRRDFHIGPRFVSELRNRPSDMRPEEQLLDAMVRVQDVDEERWYPASVMRVTPKQGGEDAAFTLAVWAPDVSYVFPSVELFAITSAENLLVPHEKGPELAGDRWTWLDEKNALVEKTPQREWDDFVTRARKHAVKR
jgi:hypothetical protein